MSPKPSILRCECCGPTEITRRSFLKATVTGLAASAGPLPLLASQSDTLIQKNATSETLVATLYRSLTETQKQAVVRFSFFGFQRLHFWPIESIQRQSMCLNRQLARPGCVIFSCLALLLASSAVKAEKLDDFIVSAIEKHHVPGLSLAVIEQGAIAKAAGYGFADKEKKAPVTTATLFQAGSISKSVAALGVLHLVEVGRLNLDADVNTYLTAWKVPENDFTKREKVTLRRILSHSAGLTVHGFPGYAPSVPRPTLIQVLDGASPANTAPIRVDMVPGTKFRYSGGGYTVMQQMLVEITTKSFPEYMQQTVLAPLGMEASTFEQPLPETMVSLAAKAYYKDAPVEGGWHIYPEMAAAGLWTTASDLARFAIGIQQSLGGKTNPVISRKMTKQMLTVQSEYDGLGVFLQGEGDRLRFMHAGRDEGFDAEMIGYAQTGQGAVVMINANNDSGCLRRVMEAVAHEYQWPDK